MKESTHTKRLFGVFHVNNGAWLVRYQGQWVFTYDISAATLFDTESEASIALNAILQEAQDRGAKLPPSNQFWRDVYFGMVTVEAVEITHQHIKNFRNM